MDSYSNPFLFEIIYFIISILFLITFICYRIYFKSEKSRAVLFFFYLTYRLVTLYRSRSWYVIFIENT